MSLLRQIETDGAALMSYGKQFHIAGAAQRNARDPIFVWNEDGSSCLSSAEDLSARRKILLVMRDLRYAGSSDSRSLYVLIVVVIVVVMWFENKYIWR